MPTRPALADLTQLTNRLGIDELSDTEERRARAALDDASTLVREEARMTGPTDWDNPDDVPEPVVLVVLAAARRGFTNPEAYISETTGPFTQRRSEDEVGLWLTEKEKAVVQRFRPAATGTTSRGLWTLATTREVDGGTTAFLEDSFGAELFPYYEIR